MSENQVKTNFLIHELSKQGMKKQKYLFIKFFMPVILLSFIFIASLLINYEYRSDLEDMMAGPMYSVFYIQLIIFSVNILLGTYLTYKLSIPGVEDTNKYKIVNLLFYSLWFVLFASFAVAGFLIGDWDLYLHPNASGVQRTLLALTVPALILAYNAFKGYVISKYKTICAVSFTAFSFASLINLFVCPENDPMHILVSHHLVILPLVGALMAAVYLFADKLKQAVENYKERLVYHDKRKKK